MEYGTASYLGDGVYITAAHSLIEPPDGGKLVIGLPVRQTSEFTVMYQFRLFERTERHEIWDIGLLRISEHFQKDHPNLTAFRWYLGAEPFGDLLADLIAPGYPHALNTVDDFGGHAVRLHKGHIVGIVPHHVETRKEAFLSYELSLQVPIGLSGAPVMTAVWPPKVVGIAIGTKETAWRMKRTEDVEDDGGKRRTFITAQMQHYGVAFPSTVIAEIHSPLLDMTIEEFIERQGNKVEG
jgi:hypothetical protein